MRERKTRNKLATYSCQTANLFTYPTNSVWNTLHALDYCQQKAVGDLHEHGKTGCDDGLDIRILCSDFWCDSSRQVGWKRPCLLLNLVDHLFVDLMTDVSGRTYIKQPVTHLNRIYLEIEVLVFN